MSEGSLLLQIVIIIILTGINAFFSSAEMAIVSLNKNKLKILIEEGNKKAILLDNLLKEPSKFLSTIQVGITLASFFASASAATGLSQFLLKPLNIPYSSQISMILITFILSYVTLVFGELIPKRIALRNSENIALSSVGVIVFISTIFSPFVKFLTFSTNLVLTILRMKEDNIEEKVSKEELRSLVEVGKEHGVINESEQEMIENIIEFDEKIAREIMIPRTKVFLIDKNISIHELFENKVRRINFSLDTLIKEKYNDITRRNDFDKTMESLFYAIKKGFKVKINVVLIGGFNDDEIQDFVNLANDYDLEVRFIELMQIGETANWSKDKFVSNKIVLEKVPKLEFDRVSGVAKIYKIKGQKGRIGLISPISCSFCEDCNRIRLTSDGKLKPCLHSKDEINLKGLSGEELEEVFKRGIFEKPEKHHLEDGKSESARDMNKIGG